jgi:hypothetical protein
MNGKNVLFYGTLYGLKLKMSPEDFYIKAWAWL